jgi:chemotaxis protein histidine kinase CheA
VFVTFLEGARERLARVDAALSGGASSESVVAAAFGEVHTVKGEARAFGLADLAEEAHAMEAMLSVALIAARSGDEGPAKALAVRLAPHLVRARQALERGRDLFVEASPIGSAALDQVTVSRADLDALETALDAGTPAVRNVVARLASRPFGEAAAPLLDLVPAWAEQLGKAATVIVDGKARLVPPALAVHLTTILTQLARNAVAHGFESRSERAHAGKPTAGTLRLTCDETPDGAVVHVADDGAGFDEAALSERAAALGIAVTGATDAAFMPGVSTLEEARGDLSGRGVGLSAVRATAERAGYSVSVTSRRGAGTTVSLRPRAATGEE